MPSKQKTSTKTVKRVAAKAPRKTGIKPSYKLGKRKFSNTLLLFVMIGALVGGYLFFKSQASSSCINQDESACSGWQSTLPGEDKAVDGYNAELVLAYFMPNFDIGDATSTLKCAAAYRYVGVNNKMTYSSYENALKSNFGTSHIMSVGQYTTMYVTDPKTNYTTTIEARSPKASTNVPGGICTLKSTIDDYVHAVVQIKNTGTKPWQESLVGSSGGVDTYATVMTAPRLGINTESAKTQEKLAIEGRMSVAGSPATTVKGAFKGAVPSFPTVGVTGAQTLDTSSLPRVCTDGKVDCVVNPGESVWLDVTIPNYSSTSGLYYDDCVWAVSRCPKGGVREPGKYQLPLQMVLDGKYWFGNKLVVDFEARDDLVDIEGTIRAIESQGLKYEGPDKPGSNLNGTPSSSSSQPIQKIKPTPNSPYESK